MTRAFFLIGVFFALFPSGGVAQNHGTPPRSFDLDPIECYLTMSQLNPYHKGHLAPHCFIEPVIFCSAVEDAATCLQGPIDSMRAYLEQARQRLPEQLPLTGIWPGRCARAHQSLFEPERLSTSCIEGEEILVESCVLSALAGTVLDAHQAAKLAGVEEMYLPVNPLKARSVVTAEARPTDALYRELSPVRCLAAIATLPQDFEITFEAACIGRSAELCDLAQETELCLDTHVQSMRDFLEIARPVAMSLDVSEFDRGRLERTDVWTRRCPIAGDNPNCTYFRLGLFVMDILDLTFGHDPAAFDQLFDNWPVETDET